MPARWSPRPAACRPAGGEAWVGAAARHGADDDGLRTLVAELAVEPLRGDSEPDGRYASAVLARLQEVALSRRIAELKRSCSG